MESLRSKALVHLILACQLCQWQAQAGALCSLENPPRALFWAQDVVKSMVAELGMVFCDFDSCRYGHRDPGNGFLYKKPQRLASTGDLSLLARKCNCTGTSHHQRVEGRVESGSRRGERRSTVSGEYPEEMCRELANCIGTLIA